MNKSKATKLIAVNDQNTEYEFSVKNNYEYSYKNQTIKIELFEEADGFTILSGKGVRYPVEILSRKQNKYEVLINGVSYLFSVETPFSVHRNKILASQKSTSKSFAIIAPMPGKIIDILVKQGQIINNGETILILEAMKMQNTITANGKGIIKTIISKPGDTVGKNDVLVEIECL